jgi:hypothetical protein
VYLTAGTSFADYNEPEAVLEVMTHDYIYMFAKVAVLSSLLLHLSSYSSKLNIFFLY